MAVVTVRTWLVPRPYYYARPMRFGSRGPRKFLRPRQTRRSETFCLTWGGAFGSGRAVNNFSALMKDVQQPWRVQRNEHFYSMHVFIVESRLNFQLARIFFLYRLLCMNFFSWHFPLHEFFFWFFPHPSLF